MSAVLRLSAPLATLCVLVACAVSDPPHDILSAEKAMMYGYVDAEYPIDAVDFREFGVVYIAPFRRPPRVLVYGNGYFMAENLKPGKYFIAGFQSGDKSYQVVNSPRSSYQNVINIRPGSLNYIGSHRIVVHKRRLLGHGEFEVVRIRRPDERNLLRFFYELTDGTGWQKKIVRRMKQLRQ